MASSSGQSEFLKKVGPKLQTAMKENANREVESRSYQEIPAGVRGVAQLRTCKMMKIEAGKTGAGEYQFVARAIATEPATKDGHKVEGLATSVYEPMHDTPTMFRKTFNEHFIQVREVLIRLGVDPGSLLKPEQLEGVMAALEKEKPHFSFNTATGSKTELIEKDGKWRLKVTKGNGTETIDMTKSWSTEELAKKANPYAGREPRINHYWGDKVEDYEPPEAKEVDETPEPTSEPVSEPIVDEPDATSATSSVDNMTTEQLVEAANSSDDNAEDAQKELKARALAAGVPEEDVDAEDKTWADIGDLIEAAAAADGPATQEEVCPVAVGQVHLYKPFDFAKKTKAKKAVEIDIKTIDKASQTCTAIYVVNKKTVVDAKGKPLNIKWADLEQQ